MTDDRDMLRTAAELAEAGRPFVMATVIRTQGSGPRDPGAKMIWQPNQTLVRSDIYGGNGAAGTVGGGQFELLVLEAAERHFRNRSCGIERLVLGAEADQCCGGVMEVFLEYHGPRHRAVIFGAGHVSHALAPLLQGSSIELFVADDRPEWNSAARFPTAQRLTDWAAAIQVAREQPAATLVCVMTCSHDTDFELLRNLLAPAPSGPPGFIGLIGSRSKRACLFSRLVASGLSDDMVKVVHCPVGVGDTGKEPRQVAISIAAQMLMETKRLAHIEPTKSTGEVRNDHRSSAVLPAAVPKA